MVRRNADERREFEYRRKSGRKVRIISLTCFVGLTCTYL